jgi:1-aminocyclopropane-1-carboxylate deaminase/D-cysteine desulfhydrase-like pyridoxal-dependent ACC family enzyme
MPTSTVLTTRELRRAAEKLPRVPLGHFPTPLEHLPRFSAAIGGPPIWIKRDDCSGLAFGGNKTRHNEFILGLAAQQGTEQLVWGAGVQSNNCRQTAAACAKLGWPIHLILSRANHGDDVQGNLLLDHMLGATVDVVDEPVGPGLFDMITDYANRLRAQGKKVFAWDSDLCKPLAAVSYALCVAEIAEQMHGFDLTPSALYICSAGATGSGVILGKALLGLPWHVRTVAPLKWPWDVPADLAATANKAASLMGLTTELTSADIDVTHDYIGRGYGIPTEGGMEATRLLARTEGILIDPVYTAKALACLIDDIRSGRVTGDDPVVFVHTGGTPALFAYRDEFLQAL